MKLKLLAFAASSSTKSINKKLAIFAANLLDNTVIDIIDLNDYELPLFSEDREIELGKPKLAKDFLTKIDNCDALIISFAEHNGTYTAAYKNLFDWCSRITPKVYQNKPMILLATSPGQGGAANVLNIAINSIPYFGGIVKASFSLPSFYNNFDMDNNKISDNQLVDELKIVVDNLLIH